MTRLAMLIPCLLAALANAQAFADGPSANLDDALKCPDGMAAVKSCSQYKQAANQTLWIRICEVPGTTAPNSTNCAMVLANKDFESKYVREAAVFGGYNSDTKSISFNGTKSPTDCDGNVTGPCTTFSEYQYSNIVGQPYNSQLNTLLRTQVTNGNTSSDLGVRVSLEQFSCWADQN